MRQTESVNSNFLLQNCGDNYSPQYKLSLNFALKVHINFFLKLRNKRQIELLRNTGF
jgi:hypothetical protein